MLYEAVSFFFFFLMGHFIKVFIEFVTILFLFHVFWPRGTWDLSILALQPGTEPVPPVLAGEVPATGPPGKPQGPILLCAPRATSDRICWAEVLWIKNPCSTTYYLPEFIKIWT